jgi:hypothetical protein
MTTKASDSATRTMRVIALAMAWLTTVAAFAVYGWLNHDLSYESAVTFGVIGVGAACSIVVGVIVIREVRAQRMKRGTAILHLVTAAGGAAILPFFIGLGIYEVMRVRGGSLFQGEGSLWLTIVPLYSVLSAICVFTVCLLSLLGLTRPYGRQEPSN